MDVIECDIIDDDDDVFDFVNDPCQVAQWAIPTLPLR